MSQILDFWLALNSVPEKSLFGGNRGQDIFDFLESHVPSICIAIDNIVHIVLLLQGIDDFKTRCYLRNDVTSNDLCVSIED